MRPTTAFADAAAKEAPNESRYEASARGESTAPKNSARPSDADFTNRPASGISTSRLRYVKVKPSVRPKPGSTERRLAANKGLLSVRAVDLAQDGAVDEGLGLRRLR